ncbi:hypothetical protein FQN53_008184 [Emmonsiellopsis sp. PD_33]|nr:hypothetical protein FQN53_008184 [Emmonsiellopsis sp. PD_33]
MMTARQAIERPRPSEEPSVHCPEISSLLGPFPCSLGVSPGRLPLELGLNPQFPGVKRALSGDRILFQRHSGTLIGDFFDVGPATTICCDDIPCTNPGTPANYHPPQTVHARPRTRLLARSPDFKPLIQYDYWLRQSDLIDE